MNLWRRAAQRFPENAAGITPGLASQVMVNGDERRLLSNLGPSSFASVMGTGIAATAADRHPDPGHRCQLDGHPSVVRSHVRNPQMARCYGVPPMALLTVGAGTLLVVRT